jgi:hypothetical protein
MSAGTWVVATGAALLLLAEAWALVHALDVRRTLRHLDQLEAELVAWRTSHRDSLRSVERQVATVAQSMTRAEDGTRSAGISRIRARGR